MLVVKLELWPFGEKAAAREIGRIEIGNVGGTAERGRYDAQATGEAAGMLVSTAMHAIRHSREEGAWKLVFLALAALLGPRATVTGATPAQAKVGKGETR
jgi:hypothetical protein